MVEDDVGRSRRNYKLTRLMTTGHGRQWVMGSLVGPSVDFYAVYLRLRPVDRQVMGDDGWGIGWVGYSLIPAIRE